MAAGAQGGNQTQGHRKDIFGTEELGSFKQPCNAQERLVTEPQKNLFEGSGLADGRR
jgi:hypothetical protein